MGTRSSDAPILGKAGHGELSGCRQGTGTSGGGEAEVPCDSVAHRAIVRARRCYSGIDLAARRSGFHAANNPLRRSTHQAPLRLSHPPLLRHLLQIDACLSAFSAPLCDHCHQPRAGPHPRRHRRRRSRGRTVGAGLRPRACHEAWRRCATTASRDCASLVMTMNRLRGEPVPTSTTAAIAKVVPHGTLRKFDKDARSPITPGSAGSVG